MIREFVEAAVKANLKKFIYLTCTPATLVHDLQEFQKLGYRFNHIDPVDMFLQTPHHI